MDRTARSRRTVLGVGSAAIAAAMLGIHLTGESSAQDGNASQVPATSFPLGPVVPPEIASATDWVTEGKNLAMTRDASDSAINAGNVHTLGLAWSYPLDAVGGFGGITSNPIVYADTVYIVDMQSNIHAIDRENGERRWRTNYDIPSGGPNGLAIGYGMIAGVLGDTAEAVMLDAMTGEEAWRTDLSSNRGEGIAMAPLIYDNTVYVSTIPGNSEYFYRGGQKGIFYALDISSGHVIWQWDTTTDNLWGNARVNSGGGLWHPPSVDEDGNLYLGIANAGPFPGAAEFPNATSRPGPNDYANCLVKLDPVTGSVAWYINLKPHDLFDLDNQLSPVLTTATIDGIERNVVLSTGKHGRVVCADRGTGEELWRTLVGKHQNDDLQEIPEGETVEVFPGTFGGVETPFAVSNGVAYLPVLNLGTIYSSTGTVEFDVTGGASEVVALDVATGELLWSTEVTAPLYGGCTLCSDVVFSAGLDGVVRGFNTTDGAQIFTWQTTGINASLAAGDDMLLIPAGGLMIPSDDTVGDGAAQPAGLYALKLGSATPEASPTTSSHKTRRRRRRARD